MLGSVFTGKSGFPNSQSEMSTGMPPEVGDPHQPWVEKKSEMVALRWGGNFNDQEFEVFFYFYSRLPPSFSEPLPVPKFTVTNRIY